MVHAYFPCRQTRAGKGDIQNFVAHRRARYAQNCKNPFRSLQIPGKSTNPPAAVRARLSKRGAAPVAMEVGDGPSLPGGRSVGAALRCCLTIWRPGGPFCTFATVCDRLQPPATANDRMRARVIVSKSQLGRGLAQSGVRRRMFRPEGDFCLAWPDKRTRFILQQ